MTNKTEQANKIIEKATELINQFPKPRQDVEDVYYYSSKARYEARNYLHFINVPESERDYFDNPEWSFEAAVDFLNEAEKLAKTQGKN